MFFIALISKVQDPIYIIYVIFFFITKSVPFPKEKIKKNFFFFSNKNSLHITDFSITHCANNQAYLKK